MPAVIRGEGDFGEERLDGEVRWSGGVEVWMLRCGGIGVEVGARLGGVGFGLSFADTTELLGVKSPSWNVGKFKGVSIRLLRLGGAISDELLGGIDVEGVATRAATDGAGAVGGVQIDAGVNI